ncbi:MAG: hypothetical protein NTV29_15435 [Planctomycetota bacterium]|nr:hypothetical protein [Planctomycetota bacterium]
MDSSLSHFRNPFRIRPIWIWIAAGLCAILAACVFVKAKQPPGLAPGLAPGLVPADGSKAVRELLEKHLQKSESQIQQLAGQGYPAIEIIFSKAYDNVPTFADSILGFRSKWNLVLDKIPWNDKDRHNRFLKDQFQEHIFSPEEIESAVRQAVGERLNEVRDIESQMLIAIRADIEGLPELDRIETHDASDLELRFQQAIAHASDVVSQDLSSNIESQLVSLVAGEVMAQVAIRMGVSAGILSTGAASGWATLGIGLVAGILVDQLVTRIWGWWSEPEAELQYQVSKQLSLVHDLICKGDSDSEGLDGRFTRWITQRNEIRRDAIFQVFLPNDASQ